MCLPTGAEPAQYRRGRDKNPRGLRVALPLAPGRALRRGVAPSGPRPRLHCPILCSFTTGLLQALSPGPICLILLKTYGNQRGPRLPGAGNVSQAAVSRPLFEHRTGGGDGHDARLPPSLSGPSAAPTPHSAAPRPPPGLPPILSSPPEPRAALCHSAEAPDRCAQPGPVRARTERRCQARGAQMPLCERPLRTIFLPPSPHGGERGRGEEGKKRIKERKSEKERTGRGSASCPAGRTGTAAQRSGLAGRGRAASAGGSPGRPSAPFATRIPWGTASACAEAVSEETGCREQENQMARGGKRGSRCRAQSTQR